MFIRIFYVHCKTYNVYTFVQSCTPFEIEVKGRHCKRGGGQRGWGSEVKDKNRIGKGKRRGKGESELLSEGNSLF